VWKRAHKQPTPTPTHHESSREGFQEKPMNPIIARPPWQFKCVGRVTFRTVANGRSSLTVFLEIDRGTTPLSPHLSSHFRATTDSTSTGRAAEVESTLATMSSSAVPAAAAVSATVPAASAAAGPSSSGATSNIAAFSVLPSVQRAVQISTNKPLRDGGNVIPLFHTSRYPCVPLHGNGSVGLSLALCFLVF
jgi:hypothetical protein